MFSNLCNGRRRILPAGCGNTCGKTRPLFAGDNLFSAIRAKAFLLVDEGKGGDEALLRQL